MALALTRLEGTPFLTAARSALHKLIAAMQAGEDAAASSVPREVASAVTDRRVLRLRYRDRTGATTQRDVEPLGYVAKQTDWYLVAWCRLRDELRAFRTDRILSVSATAEVAPPRPLDTADLDIPRGPVRRHTLH